MHSNVFHLCPPGVKFIFKLISWIANIFHFKHQADRQGDSCHLGLKWRFLYASVWLWRQVPGRGARCLGRLVVNDSDDFLFVCLFHANKKLRYLI